MRIEEITKSKLSGTRDKELLILKLRFTQLWDKNFKDNDTAVVGSLNRNKFLKNYKLLLDEINTRKIEKSTSPIDKAVFKKAMAVRKFGIDVSELNDVIVVSGFIHAAASGISIEKIQKALEVQLEDISDNFEEVEQTEAYIPVYDLVLKAKSQTEIIEVSKPYSNEHSARLQEPDKFVSKSFRRTKGGLLHDSKKIPSTISIIWGKLDDKAKSADPPIAIALRFAKKDWTSTKAKKYLSDNEIKFIVFEPAKKVNKKLLPKAEKKEAMAEEIFVSVYPLDKADSDERIVCGVVYEPDVEDAQGDKANEVEIRKAAYQFMEQVQTFKVMHKGKKVRVKVLESYVAPVDFTAASQTIKKGSWILTVRVLDKKIWKAVKEGTLTGFSMAGYANATA